MSWERKIKKYTGVNVTADNANTDKLRKKIIDLSSEYFDLVHKKKKIHSQ